MIKNNLNNIYQKGESYAKQIAGNDSVQIAKSYSTQIAGKRAKQTAINYATQIAGVNSIQKCGCWSKQTAGYGSIQIANFDTEQVIEYFENSRLVIKKRIVTEIEAKKPYKFYNGDWHLIEGEK